jgi:hypothetical protein
MKIPETNNGFALYLNQQVQSHHVFDTLLNKVERADKMIISSFAVTEAYVRRIIKNRYRINQISLFLDFTIASRNMDIACFAGANVDELYLVNNHSKTIWVKSESGCEYLAVMSNNATNNHRFECGFICSDPEIISLYLSQLEQMKLESVLFNGRQ